VIASLAIFNGFYPAITTSTGAITSTTEKVSDRLESRIEIIQVGDDGTDVYFWVKNIGTSEIQSIEYTDIFFGPSTDFYRVTYGSETLPSWEYQLEGDNTRWKTAVTMKVIIHPAAPLTAGTYLVKVVIPNGIYDELSYSME
jgi:archaeal flagellar protein FlaG